MSNVDRNIPEGGRRQSFTTDKPLEAPTRPDVLGSAKWHDTAAQEFEGNAFFREAATDHARVKSAVDALDEALTTRDPRMTPAAHAEQVTRQAEQSAKSIEQRIPRALERNAATIRNHRATMDDALKIASESRHSAEIRSRLSAMSDDDRRAAINQAAADGDHDVMAAVLHGPSFLVGMSAEDKDRAVDTYRRRHAPKLVAELEALERSTEKLEAAHFEAVSHIRRNYINRKHDPEVQRAEAAKQRQEAALQGLVGWDHA